MQVLEVDASSPTLRVAPETFNVRLEELSIIDLAFLAPCTAQSAAAGSSAAAAAAAKPVLALLYEDNKHARHVKTYTLNLKKRVSLAKHCCNAPVQHLCLLVSHKCLQELWWQISSATASVVAAS